MQGKMGHAKEGREEDIFNYAIAYDRNNREPLFYESYPGSIVDVSQLQHPGWAENSGNSWGIPSVPAALKELEKIEMLKGADSEYNLDYAVTATQKAILKAFDMTADNIRQQARCRSALCLRSSS